MIWERNYDASETTLRPVRIPGSEPIVLRVLYFEVSRLQTGVARRPMPLLRARG